MAAERYDVRTPGIATLSSLTDAAGNYHSPLTYASGQLSTITDPGGRTLTLSYTAGP